MRVKTNRRPLSAAGLPWLLPVENQIVDVKIGLGCRFFRQIVGENYFFRHMIAPVLIAGCKSFKLRPHKSVYLQGCKNMSDFCREIEVLFLLDFYTKFYLKPDKMRKG